MSAQLAFVTTDNFGKPKTGDRHLIRSHCMRGKNKRDSSRRSAQQARKVASHSTQGKHLISLPESSHPHTTESSSSEWHTSHIEYEAGESSELLPPPLPMDMALISFAVDIDNRSQELLFNFFVMGATTKSIFPVKLCIDYDSDGANLFNWLFHDTVYFHAVVFAISSMHDNRMQQTPSRTTCYHLRRTLSLLNKRLSEQDACLMDTTIYAVLALALMANISGDHAAAEKHILGLRRIVNLRGGLQALRQNPKLHFTIDQLLLSWSINTGGRSRFFTTPASWDPLFVVIPPYSGLVCFQSVETVRDSKLMVIFQDLKQLSTLINDCFNQKTLLKAAVFQESVSSIQNRLLRLQGTLENVVAEALRLAMLAFLTTMFQMPGSEARHAHLDNRLRDACQAIELSTTELRHLMMWMLMVGSISVFKADELWLREKLQAVVDAAVPWEELRRRLQGIGWVSCIHDEPGRKAYDILKADPGPPLDNLMTSLWIP